MSSRPEGFYPGQLSASSRNMAKLLRFASSMKRPREEQEPLASIGGPAPTTSEEEAAAPPTESHEQKRRMLEQRRMVEQHDDAPAANEAPLDVVGAKGNNMMMNLPKFGGETQQLREDWETASTAASSTPHALPNRETYVDPHALTDGLTFYDRSGKPVYLFGNYDEYYSSTYRDPTQDHRVAFILDKISKRKIRTVLDIGCNSGMVTQLLATALPRARALGVDVDCDLVFKAVERHGFSVPNVFFRELNFACAPVDRKKTSEGFVADEEDYEAQFANSLALPRATGSPDKENPKTTFDLVTALSVTKWVHYHHGDQGLRRFFARVFRALNPGGFFALEPQPWASYKKKKHLSEKIKQTVAGMKLQPGFFEKYLVEGRIPEVEEEPIIGVGGGAKKNVASGEAGVVGEVRRKKVPAWERDDLLDAGAGAFDLIAVWQQDGSNFAATNERKVFIFQKKTMNS